MKKWIIILLLFQAGLIKGQSLHHLNKDLPCVNKEYKVFAHMVYDSLRTTLTRPQVEGALQTASQYFSPICISFSLCEMDTVFNYNFNILKPEEELAELASLSIAQNRINLYIISDTLKDEGTSGVCAGSVGSIKNANIFLKGVGALTHELGHFFGLPHTFSGNGDELADGSNCETAGDRICDTPADPFNPEEDEVSDLVKNCIFYAERKDANGKFYQPDVGNIMSYYQCPCGFTRGQYLKMAENYFNAIKKHW